MKKVFRDNDVLRLIKYKVVYSHSYCDVYNLKEHDSSPHRLRI